MYELPIILSYCLAIIIIITPFSLILHKSKCKKKEIVLQPEEIIPAPPKKIEINYITDEQYPIVQ